MSNPIQESIESNLNCIRYCNDQITQLLQLNNVLSSVKEIEDITSISCSHNTYDDTTDFSIHLSTENRASKLIHKLSQVLSIDFEKRQDEYIVGLTVSGTSKLYPNWSITVYGYLPESCVIEQVKIDLPENKWIKTKIINKVKCSGGVNEE